MNEQIKECWLKAAREDSSDRWDTQEEFIERFAKLIVRECVEVSINNGCGDFVDIEQKLFKHFGVSDDQ